jgi:predicted Zn-dependent peptidase
VARHARSALEREAQIGFQENADILNELTTRIENGEEYDDVFDPRPLQQQLTRASLHAAAQQALTKDRYVQVIRRPEK